MSHRYKSGCPHSAFDRSLFCLPPGCAILFKILARVCGNVSFISMFQSGEINIETKHPLTQLFVLMIYLRSQTSCPVLRTLRVWGLRIKVVCILNISNLLTVMTLCLVLLWWCPSPLCYCLQTHIHNIVSMDFIKYYIMNITLHSLRTSRYITFLCQTSTSIFNLGLVIGD